MKGQDKRTPIELVALAEERGEERCDEVRAEINRSLGVRSEPEGDGARLDARRRLASGGVGDAVPL